MKKYRVAIAGSTKYSAGCASAILHSPGFEVSWVLTPQPRLLGRKKVSTKNPLHQLAENQNLPLIPFDADLKTASAEIQTLAATHPIDFLLVVDFGYFIPSWLLKLPSVAPLNIHPSALPAWRGSSPAQFSLLYGDKKSAISLIVMDEGMDTGPIIQQLPFAVQTDWTQTEYYDFSFGLMHQHLPQFMHDFADGSLVAKPQPTLSPTPTARRLTREDGFLEWSFVAKLLEGEEASATSELLSTAQQVHGSWPATIEAAVRAFAPWPLVWTVVSTAKGPKRMHILSAKLHQSKLELQKVKIEGKETANWSEVKNVILQK